MREKSFLAKPFFVATNFTKVIIILFADPDPQHWLKVMYPQHRLKAK
jgi:hypothetical protein